MNIPKNILLPSDFSKNSSNAIAYAVDLAGKNEGELSLLHVFEVPFMAASSAFTTREKTMKVVEDEMRGISQSKLEDIIKENNVGVVPNLTLLRQGDTQIEILEVIKEGDIDLVVMGTQGETADRGMFLGSVAKGIVQHAPCPVLVVPEEATFNGINKIVYATDLQHDETDKVNYMVDFAKMYDATLIILHVDHENEVKEWSIEMLKDIIEKTNYPKIAYKEMIVNDVTEGINKYIEENKPDVLAMTTHTTTLYDKIFHKSITKQLLMHTHIPLLGFSDRSHDAIFFG